MSWNRFILNRYWLNQRFKRSGIPLYIGRITESASSEWPSPSAWPNSWSDTINRLVSPTFNVLQTDKYLWLISYDTYDVWVARYLKASFKQKVSDIKILQQIMVSNKSFITVYGPVFFSIEMNLTRSDTLTWVKCVGECMTTTIKIITITMSTFFELN